SQTVSIKLDNAKLETVFSLIRKQTGFDFIYNDRLIERSRPVSVKFDKVNLEDALNKMFENQDLHFEILDGTIVIKPLTNDFQKVENDTPKDVKGRVVDNNGNGLAGATIFEKTSKLTSTSDENGRFILKNVPSDGSLIITFIGCEPVEFAVSDDDLLIMMDMLLVKIEEANVMVNTGYQSISKERSAGSYAKPDMEVILDRTSSMNVLQRLDGLVPGLTINNSPT